jgi:Uma2 family endonuclease
MAAGTLLTLDQFFAQPDFNEQTGQKYELAHGELIVMPPQPALHERATNRIAWLLQSFADGAEILVESGFVLDEESWRRPDVAVISASRASRQDPGQPYEGGPDLAIEIVSRSETKTMLSGKIDHFLASGTRKVWAIFPDRREIHIHEVGKRTVKLTGAEVLEEPLLLPSFHASVEDLFSKILRA